MENNFSFGIFDFNQLFIFLVSIFLFIILVVFTFYVLKKLKRPELLGLTPEEVKKRWKNILNISETHGAMSMKLAIIEADALLGDVLKSLMIQGDTLGERLKVVGYDYPKIKDVWWAHKMRNNLVHDSGYKVNVRDGRRALKEFEKALKVLKVL